MAMGTMISAQFKLRVGEKFGSMIQTRSTQRIAMSHTASQTSFLISRLKGRESKIAKGTTKWKKIRAMPTADQPP